MHENMKIKSKRGIEIGQYFRISQNGIVDKQIGTKRVFFFFLFCQIRVLVFRPLKTQLN